MAEIEKQKAIKTAELEKKRRLEEELKADKAEKTRLAKIEKQKLLAAKEAEKKRLAEQKKQKKITKQRALEAKKAEKSRLAAEKKQKALDTKKAEEDRLAGIEKYNELKEEQNKKKRQDEIDKKKAEEAQRKKDQQAAGISNPNSIQNKVREKFISSSNRLPPAESALTLAMARALDSSASLNPLYTGEMLKLKIANPTGSTPKTIGLMKHLGNNQYMLEMRINQGKQTFMIGKHAFFKNIPEHFDGIRCLILIDARNDKKPIFQMVVAGG